MKQPLAGLAALVVLAGCGRAAPRDAAARDSVPVADTTTGVDSTRATTPEPVPPSKAPTVTNRPKTIDEVLAAHNDSLLAIPGVVGTAAARCEGAPCIRIMVSRMSEEARRRIPREIEGFPVRVDVTGPIVPR